MRKFRGKLLKKLNRLEKDNKYEKAIKYNLFYPNFNENDEKMQQKISMIKIISLNHRSET